MFAIGPATGVHLATGVTDLRKGFNGLYSAIKHGLGRDALTGGEAFVFCNRRRDTVKIFFVDRDGMYIATGCGCARSACRAAATAGRASGRRW